MSLAQRLGAALAFVLAASCGAAPVEPATLGITASIDPSPPQVGQNTLSITLTDDAGNPVEGVTVDVVPYMPGMGHGSNEDAVVTEKGSGAYEAHPVTFQMAGAWEVTIGVDLDSGHAEKVFEYDVPTP